MHLRLEDLEYFEFDEPSSLDLMIIIYTLRSVFMHIYIWFLPRDYVQIKKKQVPENKFGAQLICKLGLANDAWNWNLNLINSLFFVV